MACHIAFIFGQADTDLATSYLHSSVELWRMVNTPCDTVVQGEAAFSVEVAVRFINKKGLVKNNDIDCVMVIKILMIQSLIF